jgi:hypothetical protein
MDSKTIELVSNSQNFITQTHKLANSLSIPDADAKQLLLVELMQHRLSGWSDADICTAITNNDIVISYKMTYARRELLRRHYKQLHNQQQATHELSATAQDSYSIIDMDKSKRTQEDIDAAIELLPQVFSNRSTAAWVESVLRVGAEETQARYHQSRRQFSQKMNRVCRYASQNRKKLIGIMANRNDNTELKELEALTMWANMMANEDVTSKQLQHFLDQHASIVAEIVDTPKIKHQGKLVADWAHADRADQYTFCNLMAERKAKLEQYLVLR